MSLESEGVVFITIKDGKVLLEQRPDSPSDIYAGTVLIPGGHIEIGETAPYAAKREIKEELGIRKPHCYLLGLVKYRYLEKSRLAHLFLVVPGREKIRNTQPEEGKHIWVPLEEARNTLSLEVSRKMLDMALDTIPRFKSDVRKRLVG